MHSNPHLLQFLGNFHDFKTLFAFANFNTALSPTFLSSNILAPGEMNEIFPLRYQLHQHLQFDNAEALCHLQF
jgi:hypothetical protein